MPTPSLGLLMLQTRFPRLPGDVGHPNTFAFPVRRRVVQGATPQRVVRGRDPAALQPFVEAALALVDEGCDAIATSCGLVANLLGFSIPVWLEPTISRIGAASLALGLMAAGAGMQFGSLARGKTLAVAVLSIRHFVLPAVAWVMSRLFGLDAVQTTVLLAFSALPTASTCYVLAARMGYNGSYVAGLVTLSTLLGLVSLPLALGLLR